jgi:hypothetical protein
MFLVYGYTTAYLKETAIIYWNKDSERDMARIKQNKPAISAEAKSFRAIRRLSLNRTYMPLKVGAIVGYILLAMLSASTSMFGILVGAMLRMIGL